MFGFFRNKKLEDVLNATKKIKLRGVLFTIKKIDGLAYLDGSKSLKKTYDLYSTGKQEEINESTIKKIQQHYTDVFMNSVVKPKLSRKKEDQEAVYVQEIFNDWNLAHELYEEIMCLTYGKKKVKLSSYLGSA